MSKLEISLKALRKTLREVPAQERNGSHQLATRHTNLGLFILPKNEGAAMDHFQLAKHAAARWVV